MADSDNTRTLPDVGNELARIAGNLARTVQEVTAVIAKMEKPTAPQASANETDNVALFHLRRLHRDMEVPIGEARMAASALECMATLPEGEIHADGLRYVVDRLIDDLLAIDEGCKALHVALGGQP